MSRHVRVAAFQLTRLTVALALAASAGVALADSADAQIPPPQDTPYPGTIALAVDATNTAQGIFQVRETIPVQPGELTLFYPKWIPGEHAPTGSIAQFAGLTITANGQRLPWTRDKYDVYAFHVEVPAGVSRLNLSFQHLSNRQRGFQMTDNMLFMNWNEVSLYPAGHYTRDITFSPSLTLPQGWHFATALETADQNRASQSGATTFRNVTYNTLVDSPVYAGVNFKRVDLDAPGNAPVHLDLFGDTPEDIEMTPEQLQQNKALVAQAYKLFDSHHYDHYDFLFSLSDQLAGNGLEHHQSSEDGTDADYYTDWKGHVGRDLLAHEYTHSWNGKFRRPADLWTPNFNVPMGDSLLWVYEGQTQYWGYVLTARSGMWTPDQFKDALALVAANYQRNRPGFQWRNIQDTTNDETIAHRQPLPYRSWQMSEEYYSAGQMIWLAVDAKLRALTNDKKSLDTFASGFFGVDNGSFVTRTYTFDDVVAALNGVAKYDWAQFLRSRLDANQPPLDGIAASGWKLVYDDKESDFQKAAEKNRKYTGLPFGIGLTVSNKDGKIVDVRWDSPAFKAGVTTEAELVAVNGHAFKPDVLTDAIKAAKGASQPIQLLVKYQDEYKTIPVNYHGGLQYPHLARAGGPDYLSQIIKAK